MNLLNSTTMFINLKYLTKSNVFYVSQTRCVSGYLQNVNDACKSKLTLVKNKLDSLTLPERFKGTVVEKWAKFWKDLLIDYREVINENYDSAQKNPKRTLLVLTTLGFVAYCFKTNPDESSFREQLIAYSNELSLVGQPTQNPVTDNHLLFLESCYNAGLVRRLSFGAFSVIWIDNYNKVLGLYKSNCSYLKPRYVTFYERIVDVGFINKWWVISNKMKDYDINPNEWNE